MNLPQRLIGGFVAVTALALVALLPAFAIDVTGSAQVTYPTGDVTGHWVTPKGSTSPPVTPGENIEFKSKHSFKETGCGSNNLVAGNFSCVIHLGNRGSDGVYHFSSAVATKAYITDATDTADSMGVWEKSNFQVNETKFVSPSPSGSSPGIYPTKYVALAETYDAQNSYASLGSDHVDFTVSQPTGSPHP